MPAVLGPIVRLQIQRDPLKVGEKGARRYRTDPIAVLERLRVSPDGVVGLQGGEEILDRHHRSHPLRKDDEGRGVSVGFTWHYRAMQQRLGEHMWVGCGGENIIVQVSRRVEPAEASAGFVILDAGGREKGRLVNVSVAHPCKPFTGFAHRGEVVAPDVLKQSLQFLDEGTRGYCGTWAGEPTVLGVGDRLALA